MINKRSSHNPYWPSNAADWNCSFSHGLEYLCEYCEPPDDSPIEMTSSRPDFLTEVVSMEITFNNLRNANMVRELNSRLTLGPDTSFVHDELERLASRIEKGEGFENTNRHHD